jgi:hypothetical protein
MKKHLFPIVTILTLVMAAGCGREHAVSGEADSFFSPSDWLQGYAATVSGGTIDYHSPHPFSASGCHIGPAGQVAGHP